MKKVKILLTIFLIAVCILNVYLLYQSHIRLTETKNTFYYALGVRHGQITVRIIEQHPHMDPDSALIQAQHEVGWHEEKPINFPKGVTK